VSSLKIMIRPFVLETGRDPLTAVYRVEFVWRKIAETVIYG